MRTDYAYVERFLWCYAIFNSVLAMACIHVQSDKFTYRLLT